MGYYTWFSMKAKHIDSKEQYEKIIETLKTNDIYTHDDVYGIFESSEYFEDCGEANFVVGEEHKWYDYSYDMMKISKLFPNVIFRLSGEGEEKDDMWHEYYHNGIIETCRAQIIFPQPTEISWNE